MRKHICRRTSGCPARHEIRPQARENRRYPGGLRIRLADGEQNALVGQARKQVFAQLFEPGGNRSPSGSACHARVAAVVPADSQSMYARSPNA